MVFKALHMSLENRLMKDEEVINRIFQSGDVFDYKNEVFLIEKKLIDNRYIWMYCQYDNAKLYGEVIFDTRNDIKRKNTRNKNEVELRKQLFVSIDIEEQLIYISDINKKAALREYLFAELGTNIAIKNIYSSLAEFQKAVKFLKKVKFTQYKNIMNVGDNESIFMQQVNYLGLDMPEKITMKIEYKDVLLEHIIDGIQRIKQNKDRGLFEDIIIIGSDDNGIEHCFNFSSIIKSIDIDVTKRENDRYDEQEVELAFFNLLRRRNV